VYSNFVTSSGIDAFMTILSKVYGYKAYRSESKKDLQGDDHVRFGVFRANTPEENTKLIKMYNAPENRDGSLMKVIIGSPTMKEGVSLLRTRQIHILDPYWNRSRTEQIMGRGVRFCSHADLPLEERKVDVYHYYAVPSEKEAGVSVDLRILQLSHEKSRRISLIETILKETAIDCERFRHRNEPPELFCFNHALVSDTERAQAFAPRKANVNMNVNVSVRANVNEPNNHDNEPPNYLEPKPKQKPKPMKFPDEKTISEKQERKKRVRSSCPVPRRPNQECPESHPHKRPNKRGDLCCYKRPPPQTKTATK
jgi:hypothetical protein